MKGPVSLLLAAVLLAGCGGDDSDENREQPPAAGTAAFESDELPFTFEHPEEFAARTRPRGQVIGQVSIEPGALINAIKVRRTSDRELEPERYLDEFERDFEQTVEAVEQREERIGKRDFGVLEFEDSVELEGEETRFTSSSYFFAGGGATWQIECIADRGHREAIAEACTTALETIAFADDG